MKTKKYLCPPGAKSAGGTVKKKSVAKAVVKKAVKKAVKKVVAKKRK